MRTRLIVLVIILAVGMLIAGLINRYYYSEEYRNPENQLAVINPADVNASLVDSSIAHVSEGHTVSDFSFVNQLGDTITQQDLKGKIYVADFFFTTCGSICPKMTKQLQRVQQEFSGDETFKILSHTVNPKIDTVEVMKIYADKFNADHKQWWFLTGSKESLYLMARKSYLVVPDQNDSNFKHGDESDFIHTENFVLIDPDKRIRGMYDGTNPDEVSKLIQDIHDLKREYKQ
ncbi:MAG: SCO family protein [Crocinitomicaceae bacterium]|nr:SCO family protein [Crocinitomicaceae bacterium]MBK8927843.1 SCO family protein [Crocinitomicaceae bacterium]